MSRAFSTNSSSYKKKPKATETREPPKRYYVSDSRYERSYFYKADDFPEIIVNRTGRIKSLAESCRFKLHKE